MNYELECKAVLHQHGDTKSTMLTNEINIVNINQWILFCRRYQQRLINKQSTLVDKQWASVEERQSNIFMQYLYHRLAEYKKMYPYKFLA